MLLKMMLFELRYYIRQPSFYVTALVMFLLAFFASVSDSVQIGGGGNVNVNSPFQILQLVGVLGVFSIFLVVNFVGSAAIRDEQSKFNELVLSKPLNIAQYRLGRFLGAYLVTLLVFSMCLLGVWIGSGLGGLLGWLDSEQLGPNQLAYYFAPLFYIAAPSLFFLASMFTLVAQRFRSMVAMYLVAVALLVGYIVSLNMFGDIQYRDIASYIDMFGLSAINAQAEYWTIADRNTMVISLTGELLYNRLLWLGVALVGILAVVANGSHRLPQKQKTKSKAKGKGSQQQALSYKVDIKPGNINAWSHFWTRTVFEVNNVVKSYSFLVLLLLSISSLLPSIIGSFGMYGTDVWPVTFRMVEMITGSFDLMIQIVIVYYCAELVWHDRENKMGDIIDAYPVQNWVFWGSKYIALVVIMALLCVIGSVITIAYQLLSGIEHIEVSQYVVRLGYIFVLSFAFQGTLAFLLQVISPTKYAGMGLFVLYYILSMVMTHFGFEHHMFRVGETPETLYSDINGYGHFLSAVHWYNTYWLGFSLVLAALSYALWPRGSGQTLKARLGLLSYNLGITGKSVIVLGAVLFIGAGSNIYYNTNVVNTFLTEDQHNDLFEQYEREFAQYKEAPIPTTLDVKLNAEIFPAERRIEAQVTLEVENKTQQTIEKFLVNKPDYTLQWNVQMTGGKLGKLNEDFQHAWFELSEPMLPGERRMLTMSVVRQTLGFVDRGSDTKLVHNGTFIDNFSLFPELGYSESKEIRDKVERRKRDLEPLKLANKLEETEHYHEPLFAENFVTFSATVTTDESQIAMTPGYLQSKTTTNGRTTYIYEMDAPMLHFYNILSMELEVKKEQYKGISLEVYYHKNHAWNVDLMMQSTKDSLDYFSRAFGPYQHKQMRIIEFPRYRSFAQSFANTVPYSEDIGFLSDIRDPEHVKVPYYVTAHELAHQWWAHQLIGANVEGSNILSEMLSQYAAIMVMKEKYGENNLRKFLKYELDRYLRGRGTEAYEERPLATTVNQSYIHYRKGSVVMMALHDRLGEERLNAALRKFIDDYRFRTDIFPTTQDFVAYLKQDATEQEQIFIDDQLNSITLYELKLKDVVVEEAKSENAKHVITLTVDAAKKYADGAGNEEEQPLSQWIDIGLFSANPDEVHEKDPVIYLKKHEIKTGENTIQIEVDKLPKFAGVDPFIKLIDKRSGDNIKSL